MSVHTIAVKLLSLTQYGLCRKIPLSLLNSMVAHQKPEYHWLKP